MHQVSEINKAKEFVQSKTTEKTNDWDVLGSGLGPLPTHQKMQYIPYHTIPHFVASGAVTC